MSDAVNTFFAYMPWVLFALVVIVAYMFARGHNQAAVPIGQTFACNNCGHRAKREHMVPVAHEGSVLWYCDRCALRH